MQNLHSHTSYSNLMGFKDSHISYGDYCIRTHELGHRVVTSVEHGWQGNYLRCWEAVQDYNAAHDGANLKFVFGTEAYYVPDRKSDDKTNAHMLILARNKAGIFEINEMLSEANETGYYYRPRIDDELLHRLNPANVLVTTACIAGWAKVNKAENTLEWHGAPDCPEKMEEHIQDLLNHFGSSLYLEVQAHLTWWQKELNREILKLHYQLGIPLIAGLDSHYITQEQEIERKYLREESGIRMEDSGHEMESGVFEDYPEDSLLVHRFELQGVLSSAEIQQAMDNTDVALTFEDIIFERERKLPPFDPVLSQDERNKLYADHVWSSWEKYKQDVPQEKWSTYEDGIRGEIETITSTGVADYFLINEAMIKKGVANGGVITPTGRGSAGSFFTNTLLGMSTLDRFALPVSLYPERFVTADRLKSSLPDIDFNVSDQEPFARAQEEVLGKGHSYPMIAFGTLKVKSAFKLFARANGMDAQLQNEVTRQIDKYELALKHAEDDDERETIFIQDFVEPQYLTYIEKSEPYRGIVVSKSQAPCSYMIYHGDIRREVGIMRVSSAATKRNVMCTVIDGYTAEAFGYVKND